MSTEDRLRAALAARTDLVTTASLRPGSVPTDDRRPSARRRRVRVWPPLLAAAAVVAIATVAAVGSAPTAHRDREVGPATRVPTAVSTSGPATTPDAPPTASRTSTSARPPAPKALGVADLLGAPVPSLCGHPAAHLVNGLLPGIPAGQGAVILLRAAGAPLPVFGDLDGDGVADAAAVVLCRAAGAAATDRVVLWSAGPAGPRLLGAFDPATVGGAAASTVWQLRYSDGGVRVESDALRPGDPACCASGRVTVTLRWDGSQILAES